MTTYNSQYIEQKLSEIKDRKSKNFFLDSIMNEPTAIVLYEVNGHKTVLFPGNKGPKTNTWEQTKQMAFELNKVGYDVAFIPEVDDVTCADSLILTGKIYRLADFKYCVTTSSNTLAKELEHGFKQAGTIVLQLEHMDAGLFKEALRWASSHQPDDGTDARLELVLNQHRNHHGRPEGSPTSRLPERSYQCSCNQVEE